jgi:hypothetical protein
MRGTEVGTSSDWAATGAVEQAASDATPWRSWIAGDDAVLPVLPTVQEWLERLEEQLAGHAAASHDDEARLAALWSHMVPKLSHFLPDEISHVVAAQLHAAARRGAADALAELVSAERRRLGEIAVAPATGADDGVDAATLRGLLDGIAADRATTARVVIAEALETLCSIALDLELTERRLSSGTAKLGETLSDLRNHITTAAATLRALPNNVEVRPAADEQLAGAVRRCLDRYSGALTAALSWSGAGRENPESSAALLWVLQELLHRLHGTLAGYVEVSVDVDPGVTMRVFTPSGAFQLHGAEPDWLLRCRLRLKLAGGSIHQVAADGGSCLEVWLP